MCPPLQTTWCSKIICWEVDINTFICLHDPCSNNLFESYKNIKNKNYNTKIYVKTLKFGEKQHTIKGLPLYENHVELYKIFHTLSNLHGHLKMGLCETIKNPKFHPKIIHDYACKLR